jgi:hypothetical protein
VTGEKLFYFFYLRKQIGTRNSRFLRKGVKVFETAPAAGETKFFSDDANEPTEPILVDLDRNDDFGRNL